MTTINIKEIEELSAKIKRGDYSQCVLGSTADALNTLLAFYKEVNEQEPVATIADLCELDRHELIDRGYPHDACLYALPPSSAACIAELSQKLKTTTLIKKQAEKLHIARSYFVKVAKAWSQSHCQSICEEALAVLGEE